MKARLPAAVAALLGILCGFVGSCCGRWVEYVDTGRHDVEDAWPPHEATIGMAVTISEDVVEIFKVTNDGELRVQYEVVDTFFTYDP